MDTRMTKGEGEVVPAEATEGTIVMDQEAIPPDVVPEPEDLPPAPGFPSGDSPISMAAKSWFPEQPPVSTLGLPQGIPAGIEDATGSPIGVISTTSTGEAQIGPSRKLATLPSAPQRAPQATQPQLPATPTSVGSLGPPRASGEVDEVWEDTEAQEAQYELVPPTPTAQLEAAPAPSTPSTTKGLFQVPARARSAIGVCITTVSYHLIYLATLNSPAHLRNLPKLRTVVGHLIPIARST